MGRSRSKPESQSLRRQNFFSKLKNDVVLWHCSINYFTKKYCHLKIGPEYGGSLFGFGVIGERNIIIPIGWV